MMIMEKVSFSFRSNLRPPPILVVVNQHQWYWSRSTWSHRHAM